MKKVTVKTEYFVDPPREISYTNQKPTEGFYTYVEFTDGSSLWLDAENLQVQRDSWVDILNIMKADV